MVIVPALWPTQPTVQLAQGALSSDIKQSEHKVDHSPEASAEVEKTFPYIHFTMRLHGIVLNNFTLLLCIIERNMDFFGWAITVLNNVASVWI
jgi:hypothetical protein